MMNISTLMEIIPNDIKSDIITFNDIKLKNGSSATRIIIDRNFTESEYQTLKTIPNVISIGTGSYKNVPEIKKGTFVIVSNYTLKKLKKLNGK